MLRPEYADLMQNTGSFFSGFKKDNYTDLHQMNGTGIQIKIFRIIF